MAQPNPEEKLHESTEMDMDNTTVSFKLNAHAPEFVPRSHTQMPISGYIYPSFHFLGGSDVSEWFYVEEQEPVQLIANSNVTLPNYSKNVLSDDLRQKIIKQVEYQFSDMSLVASDSLAKHMNKDPEGHVPISVIASSKKINSIVSNNHLLIQALQASSNLVVSHDGKKVRRKHLFTDRDKEEFQCRTVVAENLPEDYSHQNLKKIFGVVGSVKTVRICHPQEFNSSRPKGDVVISHKLHALVEYETTNIAEKAVEKLNDERNWRKGLRVRLLHRRSPRTVLKSRKLYYDHFDGNSEEDEVPASPIKKKDEVPPSESLEDSFQATNIEMPIESNAEDNSTGLRKGWARGNGKSRGRTHSHNGRGLLSPSSKSSSSIQFETSSKQNPRGPRMPDGTKGFTMGRGKPVTAVVVASSTLE